MNSGASRNNGGCGNNFFDFKFSLALFVSPLRTVMGAVLCDGRFGDEPAPAEKAGLADLEITAHRAPPFVLSSCSYLFVAARFTSLHFVSIFQNLGDGNERSPRRWDSGEKRG